MKKKNKQKINSRLKLLKMKEKGVNVKILFFPFSHNDITNLKI